jgi:hypothetical protein
LPRSGEPARSSTPQEGHETLQGQHYKFHVVIATFEAVMSDAAILSKIQWRLCVVDEVRPRGAAHGRPSTLRGPLARSLAGAPA